MASYYIHMDQGLVVNLRHHRICSGQFSSCAPIVFYNARTHIAGLYHLAGCNQLDEMKTHHLRVIEAVVRPTDVYVLCGASGNSWTNPARGHVGLVSAMFSPNVTIHEDYNDVSCYRAITVLEIGGVLQITTQSDFANQLKYRARIDNLPDDVGFIGEKDDQALARWI